MKEHRTKSYKLIKCDVCGKLLDRSNYFRPGARDKVCCDCHAATFEGGLVPCKRCGQLKALGEYDVQCHPNSTAPNKRKEACNDCVKLMSRDTRPKNPKTNMPSCKCGETAVDCFREEWLCYDCLNPSATREELREQLLENTSLAGNGLEWACEELPKYEYKTIVHRVNKAKKGAKKC